MGISTSWDRQAAIWECQSAAAAAQVAATALGPPTQIVIRRRDFRRAAKRKGGRIVRPFDRGAIPGSTASTRPIRRVTKTVGHRAVWTRTLVVPKPDRPARKRPIT